MTTPIIVYYGTIGIRSFYIYIFLFSSTQVRQYMKRKLSSENILFCRNGHLSTILFIGLVFIVYLVSIWYNSGSVFETQWTYLCVLFSAVFIAGNYTKRSIYTYLNLYFLFFVNV